MGRRGGLVRGGACLLSLMLSAITACGSSVDIDERAAAEAAEAYATRNLTRSPAPTSAATRAGTHVLEEPRAVEPSRPPSLDLTCPEPWSSPSGPQRVEFGYEYSYLGKSKVKIDYGDGRSYATAKGAYIDSAFWHEYERPGVYQVIATLREEHGATARASCSFYFVRDSEPLEVSGDETWLDALPGDWSQLYRDRDLADLSLPGTGDVGLCSDGTVTAAAGRQGACSWHGGLADSTASGGYAGSTYVGPYVRSDGTYVSGYYRSVPGG